MKKAFLIVAVIAGAAWMTGNIYAQPREKQGQEKQGQEKQGQEKQRQEKQGQGEAKGKEGERQRALGQGGQGQGNFQRDPEKMLDAIFARIDKNSDGKISGDEIPAQMKEHLEKIDTNKDSAIDKSEMLVAMKARMQAQRDGQGNGKEGNFKPGDGKGKAGADVKGRFNQGGENGKGPQRPKRPAAE